LPWQNDNRDVTIAGVLTGRTHVVPLMKTTAAQRLYYNYRFHQPSFEREVAGTGRSRNRRDFRSHREREQDAQDREREP